MSKIKVFKSGAYVSQDICNTLHVVKVYTPGGQMHDKVKCDSKQTAREYFKAFCSIAKNF